MYCFFVSCLENNELSFFFYILRESLLALNHSATFFSSSFVVVINVLMSECELNILVSSAKRINESNNNTSGLQAKILNRPSRTFLS